MTKNFLPRARMCEWVKQSVLSVRLSVCLSVSLSACPVKNFEISTFTNRLKAVFFSV